MSTDLRIAAETVLVVSAGARLGLDGTECFESLASILSARGGAVDHRALLADVLAREALGSTVLPNGVAVPHALSESATRPSLAIATLPGPVEFGSRTKADAVVMWVSPPSAGREQFFTVLHRLLALVVRAGARGEMARSTPWAEVLTDAFRK